MTIRDLLKKKVAYSVNTGDEYYWDFKLIVDVNDDHYCLINCQDSYSGYIDFYMESVSPEFIDAFFYPHHFDNDDIELSYYARCGNEEYTCLDQEVELIPKNEVNKYLEKVEGK